MLSFLIDKIFDLLLQKWREAKVRQPNTPINFFEYLQPGNNVAKAKEILGEPIYKSDVVMIFKMNDVNIQIIKKEAKIETITAILPKFMWFKLFVIYPLKHKLGSVKICDVIKYADEIKYDTSSKHGSAWIECFFGNPGKYNYYTFGIFNGPSAIYPYKFPKLHVSIEDLDNEILNQKFNYISISNKSGCGNTFNFHAMR